MPRFTGPSSGSNNWTCTMPGLTTPKPGNMYPWNFTRKVSHLEGSSSLSGQQPGSNPGSKDVRGTKRKSSPCATPPKELEPPPCDVHPHQRPRLQVSGRDAHAHLRGPKRKAHSDALGPTWLKSNRKKGGGKETGSTNTSSGANPIVFATRSPS